VLFFLILLTKLAAKLLPSFKEEKNRMLLMGSELSSIGWVGGVVMHPTTKIQVLSWLEFGCLFLFLMKNCLVPPRLDLVF